MHWSNSLSQQFEQLWWWLSTDLFLIHFPLEGDIWLLLLEIHICLFNLNIFSCKNLTVPIIQLHETNMAFRIIKVTSNQKLNKQKDSYSEGLFLCMRWAKDS